MFFKVLAAEEENIRVLNYAPGPLVTDMADAIINTAEDDELRHSMGGQGLSCIWFWQVFMGGGGDSTGISFPLD